MDNDIITIFVAILQPGENIPYIWLHSTYIKLYSFTFALFRVRVFHIGIITTSCKSVFVLVCSCVYIWQNYSYIQDRKAHAARVILI